MGLSQYLLTSFVTFYSETDGNYKITNCSDIWYLVKKISRSVYMRKEQKGYKI